MAKKTDKIDKAVKDLAKEVKKLRKQNERLAEALETAREDQGAAHRDILALLEKRLPARDDAPEEPSQSAPRGADAVEMDENNPSNESTVETVEKPLAAFMAPDADRAPDAAGEEGPEITEAAKRRAEELDVDLSNVEGTGSGGRILVRDVEAVAEGER